MTLPFVHKVIRILVSHMCSNYEVLVSDPQQLLKALAKLSWNCGWLTDLFVVRFLLVVISHMFYMVRLTSLEFVGCVTDL